jgi:PAS domain S-box-containing protein
VADDQQPTDSTNKLTDRLDVDFILDVAGFGIWEYDLTTGLVSWDERCRSLYGVTDGDQLTYEQFVQYSHPDDVTRLNEAIKQGAAPHSAGHYDLTYRVIGATDGLLRWVRFLGKARFTVSGELLRFSGVAQDVTKQVLANQVHQNNELFSQSLFEYSPVANVVFAGPEMVIQAINDKMLTLWGRDRSVVGRPFMEAMPELRTTPQMERLHHVLRTGETFYRAAERFEIQRNGGLYVGYYEYIYKALYNTTGAIYAVLCVTIDVTEQVLARQELEQSQAALQSAIELAQLGTWSLDPVGNTVYSSDQLRSWSGAVGPISFAEGFETIAPPDRERIRQAIGQALQAESGGRFEEIYRIVHRKTGQERIVHALAKTQFDELGQAIQLSGITQDITQQQQYQHLLEQQIQQRTQELMVANQALVDNQTWLTRLFEQAPVAIALLVGPEYRIKFANASFYAIWHLSADQQSIYDQPVFDAFPTITGLGLEELLAQVRQTSSPVSGKEVPFRRVLGENVETAYINFLYAPITDTAGSTDVMVIAIDVTEQVLARHQVEESKERYQLLSEKLTAINGDVAEANAQLVRSNENLQRFAYVASHDLQEPLRKIQQFGDLLRMQYGPHLGDGMDFLERMQLAASRMSTLIKDLLIFSRISTQRDSSLPISLNTVIDSVLITLELAISEVRAQVEISELPVIFGDPTQLGQLFQNLLSNALKFRREDVTPIISVRAQSVFAPDLPPSVRPARSTHQYYRIDVADNGIGFEEKYLDRMFEVFQRLHGKGEFSGTGIGLAICEKVVTNHGGAITASSQPGQGATFSVYLPG